MPTSETVVARVAILGTGRFSFQIFHSKENQALKHPCLRNDFVVSARWRSPSHCDTCFRNTLYRRCVVGPVVWPHISSCHLQKAGAGKRVLSAMKMYVWREGCSLRHFVEVTRLKIRSLDRRQFQSCPGDRTESIAIVLFVVKRKIQNTYRDLNPGCLAPTYEFNG
jgi:hypothetical protein